MHNTTYLNKWSIVKAGSPRASEWQGADVNSFNWETINEILWAIHFRGTGTGNFWVDNLFSTTLAGMQLMVQGHVKLQRRMKNCTATTNACCELKHLMST